MIQYITGHWYYCWLLGGRSGPVFRAMSSARARFKYALRQCRLDEQMISSGKLAYHMQCHDENRFWKEITIRNRSKSTLSNCIDGATGESNIANQWKDHYSSLLNSSSIRLIKMTFAKVLKTCVLIKECMFQ